MFRELQGKLKTLRFSRFNHPALDAPLLTIDEVSKALAADRDLIHGYDVAALFAAEVKQFEAVIQANPDEGHSFVDEKWLTKVFAMCVAFTFSF